MKGMKPSVSRVYSEINNDRPTEYSDYENFEIDWGHQSNYMVTQKIGKGKYSDVFLGKCLINNKKCVVKVLRPITNNKIKREIKILQNLFGGPNIIKLFDIVQDKTSQIPSLIFNYIENVYFRELYPKLTDFEIRYYLYQILKALNYAHSNGIIHRDIKPHNIMINPKTKEIAVIDWGLAEFYLPNERYNVRVSSRFYKAPELLVGYKMYNYSMDIFSLGCTFAGMIFNKDILFRGKNNHDQLIQIAKVLGTDSLNDFLKKYKITLKTKFKKKIGEYPKKDWSFFVNESNKNFVNKQAFDLLDKMLLYDHQDRITAFEAMEHPYFDSVKEFEKKREYLLKKKNNLKNCKEEIEQKKIIKNKEEIEKN
ncbi:casein kinase ii subunit alpha-2 [Anaeramoeba flamelloides]|uniref:non-specific serine/threonine protein kinase n=1 Tax=Anaeramoeba flamelloides TaxID=1746091 RepID=A0AAV8A6P7_9EUKA|nr:casein kinase ii subunit alpha-2 [Anaeramoeba flamelloides]